MNNFRLLRFRFWPMWVAVIAATACSPKKLSEGQVLALVNQDEISIHQFNFAVGKQPTRMLSEAERLLLLNKLVDRQLSAQAAIAKDLDRRADVMMRIEEARRDILAAAYIDDLVSRVPDSGNELAAQYFAEHPGLFAERKVYRLREIMLAADALALPETRERLARKDDLNQILSWLREQPGGFSDQRVLRAAEQLPIEIADQLIKVGRGETISFESARGLLIYQLESAEPAPLSWQEAAPIIRMHLKKQHDAVAVKADLKQLRVHARIEQNLALLKQ